MNPRLSLHDQIADDLKNFENWHLKKYGEGPEIATHLTKNLEQERKYICSIKSKMSMYSFIGHGQHEHIATQKALKKALVAREKRENFEAKVNSVKKTLKKAVVKKMKTSKKFFKKVLRLRA